VRSVRESVNRPTSAIPQRNTGSRRNQPILKTPVKSSKSRGVHPPCGFDSLLRHHEINNLAPRPLMPRSAQFPPDTPPPRKPTPTLVGSTVVLSVGANVDCSSSPGARPEGRRVTRVSFGVSSSVGLVECFHT